MHLKQFLQEILQSIAFCKKAEQADVQHTFPNFYTTSQRDWKKDNQASKQKNVKFIKVRIAWIIADTAQ